ncbi:MAG: hypothetical protein PHG85_05290 [Candidatus Altiarchaeota archaeon]|nr:hypothetical protein [Candidatus Altiarchaeota archaeon]
MKHKVALSGSYGGGSTEKLFKELSHDDIIQLSLVGREITLQVCSENLDEVRKALQKHGIDNLSIIEWKKAGITVVNSGTGGDAGEILNISLIPGVLGNGIHPLALLHEFSLKKTTEERVGHSVEGILKKAGITDVMYIVQLKKRESDEHYAKAAEAATLKALFDAGGVVSLEQ